MPAVVCSGEIENKLPQGMTSIDIKSLTSYTNLVGKYVHATVHHRYQLNQRPVPSLKLVLQNGQGSVIDLLAVGQVAVDLNICVQGDVLICLEFEVETCPEHYSRTYQMIVDDTEDNGSLVWIFKKNNNSKAAVQIKPHQSAAKVNSYCYRPLSELKVNTIVDVYGVVKFYKPPTKTRGSDYCCTISLTDSSFDNPDDKLSCNIFSPSEVKLPCVQVGNVIRFHRLKIQAYQDRKQGYNGPGFQWLLFRGSLDDREASSSSYTFEQQDKDKVKSLLEWWQRTGNALSSNIGMKKLSEVRPKDYFDLICQVIRVCDLEAIKCKLCRVWDGTKFEGALKMAKEEEFNEKVKEDGTLMEASAHLAVDVYLFDNHMTSADSVKPGDFIQLTNLHAALVSDQVELTLHGGTWFNRGVAVLPRDAPQVGQIEAVIDTLIKKKTRSNVPAKEDDAVECMHRQDIASSTNFINIKTIDDKDNESVVLKTVVRKGSYIEKQNILGSPDGEMDDARVMRGNLNGLKQLTAGSDGDKCELSKADKHRQILDPDKHNQESDIIFTYEKIRSSNIHTGQVIEDPLDISSGSGQSLWLSAYDDSDYEYHVQINKDCDSKCYHGQLQDSNVSSSGNSADGQCLQSSTTKNIDANSDSSSQTYKTGLNMNKMQSSQDSFCTACSQDIRETTGDPPQVSKSDSMQRVFLSLKSKDLQEKVDDSHLPLPVTTNDVVSLNSSILCFDTVGFTEACCAVNAQQVVVEDTASRPFLQQTASEQCVHEHTQSHASGENMCLLIDDSNIKSSGERDNQLRCMLKTASTIIGHTHVQRSSLQEVLEHAVPHKFRVLVRVQDINPRTASAVSLVQFMCYHCHHLGSAASLQVPLDTYVPENMCPNCGTQPVNLKPTFIVTFQLTDGKHSLKAFLCHSEAIKFFCGIEPLQLVSSDDCVHQVQEWLERICPLNSTIEDRPLLECCLFSYGAVGNVKYQIFDTMLVP